MAAIDAERNGGAPSRRWRRRLAALARNEEGAVLVELAAAMIVLVPVILSVVELTRYALLTQKLDRVAMTVGDLVSRGENLTPAQITDIFAAVPFLLQPFEMGAKGRVIVTGIENPVGSTPPRVVWRREGAGTLTATSTLGALNANAAVPSPIALADNEVIVVTEVFYRFEPLLLPALMPEATVRHSFVFRPRLTNDVLQ
jgi:Flp pilus assembly protein TadG